ncbi:MAG: hypothetical protein U9P68_08985 [Pseudomonadota bacterium]|nr:hypothetical protein [Pseudomonadota bacterium]
MNREAYEKALLNPADTFGDPQDVVADKALTREQKVEILERWKHDAEELVTASGEGMSGGDARPALRRVAKALEEV